MKKSFTLIELIITMSIITTLTGIVIINLMGAYSRADINTGVNVLIADMKNQQLNAMLGESGGSGNNDSFGIFFNTENYILFKGSIYSESDPDNFTIDLPNSLQITNTLFPNSQIVFNRGSGEFSGYSSGNDSVTVIDPNSSYQKTINVNRLGVITSVN